MSVGNLSYYRPHIFSPGLPTSGSMVAALEEGLEDTMMTTYQTEIHRLLKDFIEMVSTTSYAMLAFETDIVNLQGKYLLIKL